MPNCINQASAWLFPEQKAYLLFLNKADDAHRDYQNIMTFRFLIRPMTLTVIIRT